MITPLRDAIWKQFGASIDMLKNAIKMWPDDYWDTKRKFFYNAYHVLIFLDYYLTYPAAKDFNSPLPFTLAAPGIVTPDAIDDVIPDKIYSKNELLDYLESSRKKCHSLIANLNEHNITDRWVEPSGHMNYSILELLLYNMRHVQHHAAQLNMMLRNEINNAPRWVGRAVDDV